MTRYATLLRSQCGILINDTNIQVADILHNLIQLPGMSSTMANELLNPADKQNVPKAVNLVHSLVHLKTLPDPLNLTESR
jgi:endonuclease III